MSDVPSFAMPHVLRPEIVLADQGGRILRGASALLRALALAEEDDLLSAPQISAALALLAERLEYGSELLHRWQNHQEL